MNKQETIKSAIKFINDELNQLYPKNEIQSFVYIIFEHLFNYSKIDIHIKSDTNLSN